MQLNGTPKGVYHSLTKHLFSYVEMHVTVCQFPSHCAFLCQMCCNSSRPDRPTPLPLLSDRLPPQLFSICCLRSYRTSIFSAPISPVVFFPLFYLPFPLLHYTSSSSSSFTLFFFCLPQCQLIRGGGVGEERVVQRPRLAHPLPPFHPF